MTSETRLDNQSPELFGPTPAQTVGPFFHYTLPWRGGADLTGASDLGARPDLYPRDHDLLVRANPRIPPPGDPIEIVGRVTDGAGEAVADAVVETWQADADGRYSGRADPHAGAAADPIFVGFGRSATGPDGAFRFRTIRPGRAPGPDSRLQAPHIAVSVFGRGLLKRLVTRLYFDGAEGNADDPVLALVPPDRRRTLIAAPEPDGCWRFDIRLQGEDETVFFAVR